MRSPMVLGEMATGIAEVRRGAPTGIPMAHAIVVLMVRATVVLMVRATVVPMDHPVPAITVLTERRGAKRIVLDRRTKGEAWNNGSTSLSGG